MREDSLDRLNRASLAIGRSTLLEIIQTLHQSGFANSGAVDTWFGGGGSRLSSCGSSGRSDRIGSRSGLRSRNRFAPTASLTNTPLFTLCRAKADGTAMDLFKLHIARFTGSTAYGTRLTTVVSIAHDRLLARSTAGSSALDFGTRHLGTAALEQQLSKAFAQASIVMRCCLIASTFLATVRNVCVFLTGPEARSSRCERNTSFLGGANCGGCARTRLLGGDTPTLLHLALSATLHTTFQRAPTLRTAMMAALFGVFS